MYKDCNLKALHPSLQKFSKGMSPTLFPIGRSQRVGNLKEDSRTRTYFLVSGIGSRLRDTFWRGAIKVSYPTSQGVSPRD